MRRWELTLELDPDREQPLFLQLASTIADDIRRGRLKPGDALPGSRELAELLGVNRNTVVAGYAELAAEGLVHTKIGGGTFVAEPIAAAPLPIAEPSRESPTYELPPAPIFPPPAPEIPPLGALNLAYSAPDVRLLPARELARAFRRAITRLGRASMPPSDPSGQ